MSDVIFCKKCEQHRSSEQFYFTKEGKVKTPCKVCKKKYSKKWREENSDYHRIWRDYHPGYDVNKNREYRRAKKEEEAHVEEERYREIVNSDPERRNI